MSNIEYNNDGICKYDPEFKGKEMKSIEFYPDNDLLVIMFTDNTFMTRGFTTDNDNEWCMDNDSNWFSFTQVVGTWPSKAIKFGMITQEEYDRVKALEEEQREQEQKSRDIGYYIRVLRSEGYSVVKNEN